MRHSKLDRLMTPVERIARVAAAGLTSATSSATKPSGAKSYDNADGTRTIIGNVANGESNPSYTMATHVGDVTAPGTPTGVTASSKSGVVVVEWDGTLTGGIPDDFCCVKVYLDGSELGILTGAGSVSSASLEGGTTHSVTATAEDDACLPDGTPAHNVSAPTAAISVTVSEGVEDVAAEVEQVRQDVADFRDDVATTYATKVERQDGDDAVKTWVTTNYTNSNDLATTYATKTLVSQTKDAIELAASQTYETQSDAAATYATKSALTVGLDGIRTEVAEDYQPKGDYATTASMNSAIQQSASSIESSVAATYETKSDAAATYATKSEVQQTAAGLDTRITTAQSTADGAYLERTATGTTIDTTGAATIRSLVVEGQSVQDGTPSPSAPVPIVSVESRNLLDAWLSAPVTSAGVTYTNIADGSVVLNGTKNGGSYTIVKSGLSLLLPAGTYRFNAQLVSGTATNAPTIYLLDASSTAITSVSPNVSGALASATITVSEPKTVAILRFALWTDGSVYTDATYQIWLERGTTAHPYQPYGCVTLVAGSTRTDIDLQGHALRSLPDGTHDEMRVDSLGRVTMTQRVGASVLNGSESWGLENSGKRISREGVTNAKNPASTSTIADALCDHFEAETANRTWVGNVGVAIQSGKLRFADGSGAMTVESWTAWLASNPTTVLYPLATPQTIDLGTIDLPAPADTLWLDAALVPTIEATWWTVDGVAGQQALDAEVTERQTLIRQFSGGVLAGYVGNAIAALVNAAGSFDVVSTTWSDGVPTGTDTLARYAANLVEIGKNSANAVIDFCAGGVRMAYDSARVGFTILSSMRIYLLSEGNSTTNATLEATSTNETTSVSRTASINAHASTGATSQQILLEVYEGDGTTEYQSASLQSAGFRVNNGTPTKGVFFGTKVMDVGTNVSTFTLFTKAELQAIVGTSWTPTGTNCAVFVMNGDSNVTDAMMSASINGSSIVRVHMNKTKTGNTRINYLIIRFA